MNFEVSDYLQDRQALKGTCKCCLKTVQWARDEVAAHKRQNCPEVTEEEKQKFANRPRTLEFSIATRKFHNQ